MWVRFLVRELRSPMLHSMAKINKNIYIFMNRQAETRLRKTSDYHEIYPVEQRLSTFFLLYTHER